MRYMKQIKTSLYYILWIAAFLCISYGIGVVTRANMGWYDTLVKSSLTPPDVAFPIVWSCLYILLAICVATLFKDARSTQSYTLPALFSLYMLINWAWSFIFFMGHMVDFGFYWIILSDIVLATFIAMSWAQGKRVYCALTLPTFAWGCFAAYLNGTIVILN